MSLIAGTTKRMMLHGMTCHVPYKRVCVAGTRTGWRSRDTGEHFTSPFSERRHSQGPSTCFFGTKTYSHSEISALALL
ncbi:hypothetical protein SCLCIDRAFT_1206942 [Scleroderma citrinum Foug A]|uniref:Uncharacterized protein n=1 Tax=Scleroderma citrinum Foug A TaxID=1036808 RepID=A0A0C3EDP5_9AGAM|nr:hypothetical protein SCLCIDRAFT_1206942 [Scleroderma citrinum Foug A]